VTTRLPIQMRLQLVTRRDKSKKNREIPHIRRLTLLQEREGKRKSARSVWSRKTIPDAKNANDGRGTAQREGGEKPE
jgi:hypothetical protein